MAKKNSCKDASGVFFDTTSNMVMSQGGTFERMKEKISAVRAVVPNKSNNEIVLVLQHFENSVDKAVQAFLEGNAAEILKEWNVTGKKKPKKKKKAKPEPEAPAEAVPPAEVTPVAVAAPVTEDKGTLNGFHAYGSVLDGDSLDSLSEQLDSASLDAEADSEPATSDTTGTEAEGPVSSPSPAFQPGGRNPQAPKGQRIRHRPGSHAHPPASSLALPVDVEGLRGSSGNKKTASNIERSAKDLQRCSASLTRYKVVMKDEMDSSIKRMKLTFAELQICLMDREVTLFAEMDKVKAEAIASLDGRQKKAEELSRLTDKSASMTEDQLIELRADIKHFVSERKYDEDLGKALKFTFELEPLKTSITEFGSVYHPRTSYSNRSPPAQPPTTSNAFRPPPTKQTFQGNRRTFQGPGYHSGGPRYNGGPHQDRYQVRSSNRYQGNGAPQGDRPQGDRPRGPADPGTGASSQHPSRGPPHPSRGPPHPSTANYQRQDRPARNGLA
ncbi:hypothetical protein NHX12_012447 [Muraenolepis orangiensis]|uniref:Spermatogenesis-associated serine-rich protein 2 n=1 Tax=Muraenolepis orangiensis TaxID=630683 RepID=A0A9Q0I747_9TELE|nr:hypothetical protein NHX12_012447 [Muraenolepis orangiensis]